jgi:DNA-binding beta-propeller fold protein YncE
VQPVQSVQAAVSVAAHGKSNPIAVLANSTARIIATDFNAPAGLTFDRMGNLYVANFNTNSIDRISADGTRSQFSSGSNLRGPIGLAADDTGNIYVANYLGNTVARISPAGVSTIIGTGFKKPYYLAVDREGNLFVSQQEDNTVVRLSLPRPVVSRPQ